MSSPLDIVNRYLGLTSSAQADLPKAAELLTDDVAFTGPLMRTTGKDAYVGLLQQFLPAHVSTRVLRQFADGNEVCSIDELTVRTPAGGTVTLAMAEWFKLRDGRIAEHTLYYDPREFAAAFGMTE
jgi:predicted SnoaL-like aldol condensation-catalyzing enzyme